MASMQFITEGLPKGYRIVQFYGAYTVEIDYGYNKFEIALGSARSGYKTKSGARRYIKSRNTNGEK